MIQITPQIRILVAVEAVDGRKGIDSLARLCREKLQAERHRGTCYRAANRVVMGRTTGRGNNCPAKRPNRSIKEVLGYPLTPRFRELLIEG
jgi:hypothetical protein